MNRIGLQGLLLFSGFGAAQALSFARNALLGHALSPRDFGIAASITLLLQLVETLSDLGHDRLIVQAQDGDSERFLATTHTIAAARGVLLALVLLVLAAPAAQFFAIPEAAGTFALVALVPVIKGFVHLDCRRAQRRFDNRPQLIVEVVPQALALLATLPVLSLSPSFSAVVWLAILQAATSVIAAYMVSVSPFRFGFDASIGSRLVAFGWPILFSALPLVAVYQGDRAIIGRVIGIEALAAFSAAFMLAMVPGLLAARAGHALMLPVFSAIVRRGEPLTRSFALMCEATAILAALYLSVFILVGETLVTVTFGNAYQGLGPVVAWLAAMWSMRMLQAVPGMALMAAGHTKPFLVAGIIRASVLPIVLYAARDGATLSTIAAIGCAGEAASLLYIAWRLDRLERRLGFILITRSLFLVLAAVVSILVDALQPSGLLEAAALVSMVLLAILASGIGLMPGLLAQVRRSIMPSRIIAAE